MRTGRETRVLARGDAVFVPYADGDVEVAATGLAAVALPGDVGAGARPTT